MPWTLAMRMSRCLRGSPKITASRKGAICALAREMGYRPSPALSRVAFKPASRRSKDVEQLALLAGGELATGANLAGLRKTLGNEAATLGYDLKFHDLNRFSSAAQLDRHLYQRGIEGLLMFIGEGVSKGMPEPHQGQLVPLCRYFPDRSRLTP